MEIEIIEICPKCKTPMVRSMVTGNLVLGAECFCREAHNYSERDITRRKKEAKEPEMIKIDNTLLDKDKTVEEKKGEVAK